MSDTKLWSFGHSNAHPDSIVTLMNRCEVDVVVDVRSSPFSRYVPHFNRDSIRDLLNQCGCGYVYLGDELGGRPKERQFYDDAGHVDYEAIAGHPRFRSGLERLLEVATQHKVAMMCSEEDPAKCHRHLLIANQLLLAGVEVFHARHSGEVVTDSELQRAKCHAQPGFFDEEANA